MIDDLIRVINKPERKSLSTRLFAGLRPLLGRSDFGAGAYSGRSEDGGFDEFREF